MVYTCIHVMRATRINSSKPVVYTVRSTVCAVAWGTNESAALSALHLADSSAVATADMEYGYSAVLLAAAVYQGHICGIKK